MATVRTPEGSDRFKKPIGSPLDDASGPEQAPPPAPVSEVHLRALRAAIMAKMAVGDTGAIRALTERFRSAYAQFSEGKTPGEVDRLLNTGPADEQSEAA